jgi:hypothetical protein
MNSDSFMSSVSIFCVLIPALQSGALLGKCDEPAENFVEPTGSEPVTELLLRWRAGGGAAAFLLLSDWS